MSRFSLVVALLFSMANSYSQELRKTTCRPGQPEHVAMFSALPLGIAEYLRRTVQNTDAIAFEEAEHTSHHGVPDAKRLNEEFVSGEMSQDCAFVYMRNQKDGHITTYIFRHDASDWEYITRFPATLAIH